MPPAKEVKELARAHTERADFEDVAEVNEQEVTDLVLVLAVLEVLGNRLVVAHTRLTTPSATLIG